MARASSSGGRILLEERYHDETAERRGSTETLLGRLDGPDGFGF